MARLLHLPVVRYCPGGCCTDLEDLPLYETVVTDTGAVMCLECVEADGDTDADYDDHDNDTDIEGE